MQKTETMMMKNMGSSNASISVDGKTVTLNEKRDEESLVGIEVDMVPPSHYYWEFEIVRVPSGQYTGMFSIGVINRRKKGQRWVLRREEEEKLRNGCIVGVSLNCKLHLLRYYIDGKSVEEMTLDDFPLTPFLCSARVCVPKPVVRLLRFESVVTSVPISTVIGEYSCRKPYKCKRCLRSLGTYVKLCVHESKCRASLSCSLCERGEFENGEELKWHMVNECESRLLCPQCVDGTVFFSASLLKRHLKSIH